MSFFQNPFFEEYRGTWPLGDRSAACERTLKGNAGRSFDTIAALNDPVNGYYNLTGNTTLTIKFAYRDFTKYNQLAIAVAASSPSQSTGIGIVAKLNENSLFSTYFEAKIGPTGLINIESKKPGMVKFYVVNGGAESVLGFNKKAGVGELPTYFARHTVAKLGTFADCTGSLIQLDPSDPVDAAVINNAVDARGNSLGFDSTVVRPDYKLLNGQSGIYLFTVAVDGGSVGTSQLIIPAGSKVGDLVTMVVTVGNNEYNIPYTLTDADAQYLVVPGVG